MRVFLFGEAAAHRDQLLTRMAPDIRNAVEVRDLPREAAHDDAYDDDIRPGDVAVALRLRRDGRPLPPMGLLHVPGAGLDGIDMENLAPQTAVCNVFEHEIPIAEFVLASMLEWEIDRAAMTSDFTRQSWPDRYRSRRPHGEIHGKTLGLIGYGRIGQAIWDRAAAFGMTRLACAGSGVTGSDDIVGPDEVDRVLEAADYLVVACPLTDATRGLLDARALARMKPGAVLINVSRAEIADEAALHDALSAGRLRGASLDVWYRYPSGSGDAVTPSDRDFHALPNVVATPHSSAWTTELMARRYAVIADNIAALHTGAPFANLVRAPQSDPPRT